MMKNRDLIISYLDNLIPNPKCELNYKKDYELLIAVMLSAQTTDKRVNEVTSVLFTKYPTLEALSSVRVNDIIQVIKPLGTFNRKALNVKSIATSLLEYNGKVPNDRAYLESLMGVGRKTANVVLSELFNKQCIAVDTHINRVSKRLGFALKNDDVRKVEDKLSKEFNNYNLNRLHHQLLLFGRYYCKAIKPSCDTCGLKNICKEKRFQ